MNLETGIATQKKNDASVKSGQIMEQSKLISKEQAEAEAALAEALPALEAARMALSDLNKSDITEIRSFTTPPEAVQVICECVSIILGSKDVSWKSAKVIMADPNFLKNLQEINCDVIKDSQIKAVKVHLKVIFFYQID